jgi:magnesium-transporting ATPase (P-type)
MNSYMIPLQQRRHFFGTNRIPTAKSASIWLLMWHALQDPTLIILIVAAVISLAFGIVFYSFEDLEWIEGIAILLSVVVVVLVASFTDYQKERQFKALQAKQVSFKASINN